MTMHIISRGHGPDGKPKGIEKVWCGERLCLNTGKVMIGLTAAARQSPRSASKDADLLQDALRDPRTANPVSPLRRLIARLRRLS